MLSDGAAAGFEVWVEGKEDKTRLNEYQIQHHPANNDEPGYTECFLETIDEPFRIVLKKVDPIHTRPAFRARTYVDGNRLSGSVILPGKENIQWDHVYEQGPDGLYEGSLRFTPLMTTDDDSVITINSNTLTTLGTIEIILESGTIKFNGASQCRLSKLVDGIADEKGKKFAMSVSVTGRKAVNNPMRDGYTFTPSTQAKIHHRFLFKYRPRPVLVQMGVIDEPESSHTPTPPPVNRKRKRSSTVIDMIKYEEEDEKGVKEEEEEEDIKPNLRAKRLRYLEDQIKLLSLENKRLREGGSSKIDPVDLSFEDD